MWSLLSQKPLSRLGKLSRAKTHETILELADAYSLEKNEIYFDQDPHLFPSILNFYRTGKLHVEEGLCVIDYANVLDYWMIKEVPFKQKNWIDFKC